MCSLCLLHTLFFPMRRPGSVALLLMARRGELKVSIEFVSITHPTPTAVRRTSQTHRLLSVNTRGMPRSGRRRRGRPRRASGPPTGWFTTSWCPTATPSSALPRRSFPAGDPGARRPTSSSPQHTRSCPPRKRETRNGLVRLKPNHPRMRQVTASHLNLS